MLVRNLIILTMYLVTSKLTATAVQCSNEREWRKIINKVFSSVHQNQRNIVLLEPSIYLFLFDPGVSMVLQQQ